MSKSENKQDAVYTLTQRLDQLVHQYERVFSVAVPVLAVLAGLFVAGLLVFSVGVNPADAYSALFRGAFGNAYATATSLNRGVPLILSGLGVAIAFRCGVWNIGSEGQINMGGLAASVVGIYLLDLPPYIHIPVGLLAGFLGGAIWSGIAGYLKAKNDINEIITTIMLNYIAIFIVAIMVKGPIQEPTGFYNQTVQLQPNAYLPIIWEETRLHSGLIVALVAACILYVVLWHTPFGFEVRTIGANIIAARHAGMKVMRNQIITMMISGGLAGLAGAVEIMGSQYRLRESFLFGFGYESIAVALLGQLQPFGIVISGFLFGALRAGAGVMQRAINLPVSLVYVIQGTVILFVVSSAILMRLPRYMAKREIERGR